MMNIDAYYRRLDALEQARETEANEREERIFCEELTIMERADSMIEAIYEACSDDEYNAKWEAALHELALAEMGISRRSVEGAGERLGRIIAEAVEIAAINMEMEKYS